MVKHNKTGRKLVNKGGNFLKASTKKLNKLVKRGKLKKSVGKKTLLKVLTEKTSGKKLEPGFKPVVEEADIPLHEADYEYFAKPGRNYDFLASLPDFEEDNNQQNKRKKTDDEHLEKSYEKKLKLSTGHDVDVLPIKIKNKNIYLPKDEKPETGDVEENVEPATTFEEKEEPVEVPFIEKYIKKELQVRDTKKLISQLSASVIHGTKNIEKTAQVVAYLTKAHPFVIKRWAMTNLFQVFKDIIPDYRIRPLTEKEKNQKMKKETKEISTYEETLLTQYKKYLDILVNFSKGHVEFGGDDNLSEEKALKQKRVLKRKSVEYMGELLSVHPHFNFRTTIIGSIVMAMFNHDQKTSDAACEAIKSVFVRDKSCEVILEIVRLVGRSIKAKPQKVKPKVLDTFLSLKIKEIENDEDAALTAAEMRKRNNAMSRKEKKRKKQMRYLEKELQQAAVEDNTKQKGKLRTEIISVIFLIYFRILKMQEMSNLLPSVLEGLAKFAHLINITYFSDLFAVLTKLAESGELSNRESLFCIQTALTLLIDQGSAFNIDPSKFYIHLYKTLDKIDYTNYKVDLPVALKCLDLMIIRRKKHVSDQRCMAFVKRISMCLPKLPPSGSLPLLALIRNILQNHPKCDLLLDTDSIGSGSFLSDVDNPDHCNAQSSSLYELHLLRSSYDPDVAQYAEHILQGMPREGPHRLPLALSRISCTELFKEQSNQINLKGVSAPSQKQGKNNVPRKLKKSSKK